MKKRYITTTLALMLLSAAVTYGITFFSMQKVAGGQVEAFNKITAQYNRIYEVQSNIETLYVNDYDEDKMIEGALTGMVAYLGDRWSHYLNEEEFNEYVESSSGNMVGIGVNVIEDEATGGIRVIDVYANSLAAAAGMKIGDVVVSVNDEQVSTIGYQTAVDRVRGEVGTVVRLSVYRESEKKNLPMSITRAQVQVENVKAQMFGNVGYVKIRGFDLGVSDQFITAVHNLQSAGAKAFVFDVRNNPGGAMTELVACLDILLPECTIITARDKAGNEEKFTSDASEITLPMAVLTNENSYSAAEFFAASLQEHHKAAVIGTATTGKGCAQRAIKLKNGGGLVLSISKYYTANGVSLADTQGIRPDVEVKLNDEQAQHFYTLAPEADPQIQAAFQNVRAQIK